MSPPGKRMGLTTKESVVKATRAPATSTTAASLSGPPGDAAREGRAEDVAQQCVRELAAGAVAEDDPGTLGDRGRAGHGLRIDRSAPTNHRPPPTE